MFKARGIGILAGLVYIAGGAASHERDESQRLA
jgi:hypothetical protein